MKLTNKKGFTLIEIVIVLAIAALILIIVFIAVSGAQRSRRNEQRRSDAARLLSAIEDATNQTVGPPTLATVQSGSIFNLTDTAPNADDYTVQAGTPAVQNQIQYAIGAACNGNVVQTAGTPPGGTRAIAARDVAVVMGLERSGTGGTLPTACFTNY